MKQQYKASTITIFSVLVVALLGSGILFLDKPKQFPGEYHMPNRALYVSLMGEYETVQHRFARRSKAHRTNTKSLA